MKTLALLSQKGGSGKSTLAVHLAVIAQTAARRTVIIDLDPQRSAAGWWDTRTAETPEMVEAAPDTLRGVLGAARADGVALCAVDTRPSAGADAATAAALADLVLIPRRPAIFDLKAIGATGKHRRRDQEPSLYRPEWHTCIAWLWRGVHHGRRTPCFG